MSKEWIRTKSIGLVLCVLGFQAGNGVQLAHGAHQTPKLLDMTLESLLQIDITSSTLTSKNLRSVPSSVTVFDQSQIRNMGADYLHELIGFVPGFQSYRQGENSVQYYHSARGHRSSTTSPEVLILVDGVRFNREFDNVFAAPMLSIHNVEKIEFIRGPGSALYGSNAVLGVINITTIKNKNQLQASVASADRKQVAAMGHTTLSGWDMSLSLQAFDERGEDLPLQNYTTLQREAGKDPRNGNDFQISLQRGKTQVSAMYFDREAEEYYISERTSNEFNYTQHKHSHIQIQQGLDWGDSSSSILSAVYSENRFKPRADFGGAGIGTAKQEEDNLDVKLQNEWRYHADHSVQFGIDYRHSDIYAFNFNSEVLGEYELYPDAEREVTGAYLQSQSEFFNRLDLILGARYDHYNDVGSAFSPRLGLVYELSSHQSLKLLYGEAFRAPTMNELSLRTFSGGIVGNPELDPETVQTWEVIWHGQWEDQALTLNGFYNTIESIIFRDDTLTTNNFQNKPGEESFYGIEADWAYQISSVWFIGANVTFLENLPDSDFRQSDRLASLVSNYRHQNWNFNLSAVYNGEREMLVGDDLQPIGSYSLVNAKVIYEANDHLDCFAQIKNALDKEYGTPSQREVHTEPMPNRGREFALGFTLKL